MTSKTIVQRNQKLITNQMDGEIVMMSIDNGEYYGLDEIGTRIWELIEHPISIDNLISQLTEEFDVEREECLKDTIEFFEELKRKDLISIHNDSGS